VDSIRQVAQIVADITRASSEQSSGIDQINKALTQMDEMTQQNSALVEENAASVKTLEEMSANMDGRVSLFQTAALAVQASPERKPLAAAKPALAKPVLVRPKAVAESARAAAIRSPARRMQTKLATAVANDDDWEEF
jgi:methyl-accepting chemotaxis protein